MILKVTFNTLVSDFLSGLVQWWRYCSVPQHTPPKLQYLKIKHSSLLSILPNCFLCSLWGIQSILFLGEAAEKGRGDSWCEVTLGLHGLSPHWTKQPVFSQAFLLHCIFWISNLPNCLLLLLSSVAHLFREQQGSNLERLLQLGFH